MTGVKQVMSIDNLRPQPRLIQQKVHLSPESATARLTYAGLLVTTASCTSALCAMDATVAPVPPFLA
jgi:hypothetical protein